VLKVLGATMISKFWSAIRENSQRKISANKHEHQGTGMHCQMLNHNLRTKDWIFTSL
jgi:hypothetical protein